MTWSPGSVPTYGLMNAASIQSLHCAFGGSGVVVFDETVVKALGLKVKVLAALTRAMWTGDVRVKEGELGQERSEGCKRPREWR